MCRLILGACYVVGAAHRYFSSHCLVESVQLFAVLLSRNVPTVCRYPDLAGDVDAGLHTVVFRDTDVIHPWHAAGTSDDHASTAPHSCGTEAHAKLLERQEELGLNVKSRKPQNKNNANAAPPVETEYTFPPPGEQFSFFSGGEANVPRSMYRRGSQPDRSRRSDSSGGADGADGADGESSKKVVCSGACTCPISLYCDQTFFQGPYGDGNEGVEIQTELPIHILVPRCARSY